MTTKYTSVHESPNGPGDARPTASQIIDDYNLEGELSGKTVLVTGCSSGIGVETARAIYRTGATLYLTARDVDKAKTVLPDLVDTSRVHFLHLDLNSLESVRGFAENFKSKSTQLHILIENAGVMACPEGRTVDGFETQFGINHLAHFLLFYLLKDTLLNSSTPAFNSRVVILSSCAHQAGSVHLNNLSLEGGYEPWKSYGQSKTANLWTAREIEKRFGASGIHSWAVHPGSIATELQRHVSDELKQKWADDKEGAKLWKSTEQGAATTVLAAVSPELEGKGGLYLEDTQVAKPPARGMFGVADWAYDEDGPSKLWAKSLELLKLQ
ncbi:oxidoreductase [Fusarium oxysporum f. sp. melonis 26406]|uniref:Oxidoreductase n=1 Tax=Fusarium oxysporum f. sp. melonis 26406 TaxID=1089452 RepID=W9Z6R3_FUSOX|nr:oxidoreductase [Fusarium oxysporum f. sp. melonis 26406]